MPTPPSRPRRARSRARSVTLIALALPLLLLGAPTAAHAGLSITAPATGAVVDLDAEGRWRIGFTATCPAGKTCGGLVNPSHALVAGEVHFDLRHESIAPDDYHGPAGDGRSYRANASARTTDSTAVVKDFDRSVSGRWTISTTWLECPLPTYPYETADNPCSRTLVERTVTIRPAIFSPFAALYGVRGKPGLAGTTVSFHGTAPMASYRVKVTLQRGVRQGRRTRWTTVASKASQRFSRSTSDARDSHMNAFTQFAVPRSLAGSTKLRATVAVTTVGMRPALKRRTLTTEVETRAELAKDSIAGGGGIVIGGR